MLLILLCLVLIVCALKRHNPNAKRVVVQLASGISAADADQAAAEHGYVNLGELDSLAGYHVFEELDDRKRQVCHLHIDDSALLCSLCFCFICIFPKKIRSSPISTRTTLPAGIENRRKTTLHQRVSNTFRDIRK